jgi:hypothetical protein
MSVPPLSDYPDPCELCPDLVALRAERDAQTERHKAEIVTCLRAMDKLEAERDAANRLLETEREVHRLALREAQ